MKARTVEVVEYDPDWIEAFERERRRLQSAIGDNALKIDHIGSTSVPGLAAKPVIDILIEVASLRALDERREALEALGYVAKGENGIAGRRYFQKGGVQRTHHVHAFEHEDEHLARHRALRDYLRAHPQIAAEYARIKRDAVAMCGNDTRRYVALKCDFVEHHERLALEWRAANPSYSTDHR